MPEISRFFGIVIRMYFSEHGPPHFHAIYSGKEAKFRIDPLGLMAGDLPPRVLALVMEWASLHREELRDNWHRLRKDGEVRPIPPLE